MIDIAALLERTKRDGLHGGHYRIMQRACNSLRCTLHRACSRSLRLVLRLPKKKNELGTLLPQNSPTFRRKRSVRLTRNFDLNFNEKGERRKRDHVHVLFSAFSDWLREDDARKQCVQWNAKRPIYFDIYYKKMRVSSGIII